MPTITKNISVCAAAAISSLVFCAFLYATELDETPDYLEIKRVLQSNDLPERRGIKVANNKATIHAAIKSEEQIDTNVFYDNTDRRTDIISILRPSLGFVVPFGPHRMSADYELSPHYYGVYHDQNHLDHLGRFLLDIRLGKAHITAKDTFTIFTDRAANEDSVRLQETVNNFRFGVAAELNKMQYDIGYSNIIQTYNSTNLWNGNLTYEDKNHVYNIIDASMSYRFMPKTDVIIENDIGTIHYYNTSQVPGSWFDEILVGFKGDWFARMSLDFKTGFRYQQYEGSPFMAHKTYIGPVARGGFQYEASKGDLIILTLQRSVDESTYANMNYYVANLVGLEYKKIYKEKVISRFYGSYQLHTYPSESSENGKTAKRIDNYLKGGINLRYNMSRWLSFDIKYECTNKSSNFDMYDYLDHLISLSGTAGF
ncbi:MAG: outer membrane beta-barrel protein [Candidatus Omnitrophica bacterium]|nr:outer membrane beta-barrel protein [Candidatus Omnitrophota bacterium]